MDDTLRRSELEIEREHLASADRHIASGLLQLRRQRETLALLQARGRDSSQVKRLLDVTGKTLDECERHRSLIKQRISYLQAAGILFGHLKRL